MSSGLAPAIIPELSRKQRIEALRSSISLPTGWRKVGFAQYYATPHPIYPWDQDVVRAFRRDIDPSFMPLWVRNVYRHPAGSLHVFDRHVMTVGAPYGEMPVHHDLLNVFMPTSDWRGIKPNSILPFDGILEGAPIFHEKLPGAFIPLGWDHYQRYRAYSYYGRYMDMEKYGETVAMEAHNRTMAIDRAWKQESYYRLEHDWEYLMGLARALNSEERRLVFEDAQRRGVFSNLLRFSH